MIKKILYYYNQIRAELKGAIILLLIILALFPALITSGHIVLGDLDFGFTMKGYIDRILPLWNRDWSTGTFFNGTRLPFVLPIYLLVLIIGDHPSLFEKLLIFSLIYCSAVGMFYLVSYIIKSYCDRTNLTDNNIVLIAVIAAIYYAYNPWSIIRIQHIYLLVGYAVLPAIFYQILQFSSDLLHHNKYHKTLRQIYIHIVLASLFYIIGIGAVHYLFFTAFLFIGWYLYLIYIFILRKNYKNIQTLTIRFLVFGVTFLLLIMYWLIPYVGSSLIGSVNPPSINTMDSINMLSRFSNITNVAYLNSYWWSMMDINNFSILFWIGGIIILNIIFIGNLFNIKSKITGFFIFWCIIFVILSTGSKIPQFAGLYKWIVFDNILAGKIGFIFRDSNKLVGIVAFGFSILFGTGIAGIVSYLKDKSTKRKMELMYLGLGFDKIRRFRFNQYKLFIILFSFTIIFSYFYYIQPFYNLYLNHFYTNVAIPDDYKKFINYQKNDYEKTKYFFLPRYESILTPGFEYAVTKWNLTSEPQKPIGPYDIMTTVKNTYNPLEGANLALGNFYKYIEIYLQEGIGNNLKSYFDILGVGKIIYGMDLYKGEDDGKIQIDNLNKQGFIKEKDLGYVNIFENSSSYSYAHFYKNTIYNFLGITSFETILNNKIVNPTSYANIFVNSDIETSKWNLNDKKGDIFVVNNKLDLILSNINKNNLISPFDYNNYSDAFSRWAKNIEYSPDWHYHLKKNGINNYSWDFSFNKGFIYTYAPAMLDIEPYENFDDKGSDIINFKNVIDTGDLFKISDAGNLKIGLDKKNIYDKLPQIKGEILRGTSNIWKVGATKMIDIKEQTAYIFEIVISGKDVNNIHGKVKFYDKDDNELGVSYVSAPRSVDNFELIKFSGTYITPIGARKMIFEINTLTNPEVKSYWWIHDMKIKDMTKLTKENIQKINYKVNNIGKHKIFIRTFDNIAGGEISIKINNEIYYLKTRTNKLSKFTWHYLGDVNITKKGDQELQIRNIGGFNAINVIGILSEKDYKILEDQITNIDGNQYIILEAETDGKIEGNIQSNSMTPNSNGKSVNLNYGKTEYEFDILKDGFYNIKLLYNQLSPNELGVADIYLKYWGSTIYHKNKIINSRTEYINNIKLNKGHYSISIGLRDNTPSLIKTEDFSRFSYDDGSQKNTIYIKEDSSVREKRINSNEEGKNNIKDKKIEYLVDEPGCSYFEGLLDDYVNYDYYNDGKIFKKKVSIKPGNSCFWLSTSNYPTKIKPNTEYLFSYFIKKNNSKQFHSKIYFYDKNKKNIDNKTFIINGESRTTNQLDSYEYNFEDNKNYYKDYIIKTPEEAEYISIQFLQKQRQDVEGSIEISNILFKEYNLLPGIDAISIIDNRIKKNGINFDLNNEVKGNMENKVDVSKIKTDGIITIGETYSPMWQAHIDNQFEKPVITNFFLNGYYYKKDGKDSLAIIFLPKKFVFPAFSITIITILIIILILNWNKWVQFFKKKIIKNGLIFVVLNLLANFFNYFSNIIIAWKLPIDEYGKIIGVFSLIVLLAIPTQIIQIFISNNTADRNKQNNIYKFLCIFSIIGAIINLMAVCFYQFFTDLLHIDFGIFILIITQTIIVFPLYVIRGYFQGNKEFNILGYSSFIEVIVKFILIILFIFILKKGIMAILIAVNLAVLSSFIYSYFNLKNNSKLDLEKCRKNNDFFEINKKEIWYFINLAIGISGIFALINLDMVLVQNYIPEQSGIYAIYSRLGQIIFMGGTIFISMSIPYIISSYSLQKDTKSSFFKGFFAIIFFSIFGLIGYYFFPEFIISTLFKKNIIDTGNLFFVGLSYLFIVLSYYITNYFLSIKKYFINIIILFCLLFYGINIYFSHENLEIFVLVFLKTSSLYFILTCFYMLYFKLDKKYQSS